MRRSTGIKLKSLDVLPDQTLSALFDDGRRVRFKPAPFLADIAGYDVFRLAPSLFSGAKLDKSRRSVYWTESVFVSADVIYEDGEPVNE